MSSNRLLNQPAMDAIGIETGMRSEQAGQAAFARSMLASTERLLLEGGDARIALDTDRALNRYGCSPLPDPALAAFGSSTASSISPAGFAAANCLRQRLQQAIPTQSGATVYAREAKRVRQELIALCGMTDLQGLDVVLAASGTDLHLISAQLAGASEARPGLVIMMDAEETGRGVPAALAGRHFSTRSALGESVVEGAAISGAAAVEVAMVPIRQSDGSPRQANAVDAEVETLVSEALALQRRVLLILVDGSKTGMIAPAPGWVAALRRRMPGSFEVLVDACQFRIAPATLRAYLEHDFMVAVTGSKFVTGPTFAGALFIPPAAAARLRTSPLPPALAAYSARADWPAGWLAADVLDDTANFGLLLRWEAALQELRAFRALPEADVKHFLQEFALAIQNRLQSDPLLEALPVPRLDRSPLVAEDGWDHIQTIFPFILHHPPGKEGRQPLSRDETMRVYRLLQADLADHPDLDLAVFDEKSISLRCQLGQPVACGQRNDVPVSALRICASTRLIVEAVCRGSGHAVIDRALSALNKTALLIRLQTE